MKSSVYRLFIAMMLSTCLLACSDKDFEINYDAPVSIEFDKVGLDNVILVDKGVMEYNVKITIKGAIVTFDIFEADAKTGKQGDLISGSGMSFDTPTSSYETTYNFTSLDENKCIVVEVTTKDGDKFQRRLLVSISPDVIFSEPDPNKENEFIETVSSYYGCYYATWKSGRVYMADNAKKYSDEVDFSLGDIVLSGNDTVPALVSPSKRADYGLMTVEGLQGTQFSETAFSESEFADISMIDASPIIDLPDPQLDAVEIKKGKIYLFKTSNGKKGLVLIKELNKKKGTIEVSKDNWIHDRAYYQTEILTKTVMQ